MLRRSENTRACQVPQPYFSKSTDVKELRPSLAAHKFIVDFPSLFVFVCLPTFLYFCDPAAKNLSDLRDCNARNLSTEVGAWKDHKDPLPLFPGGVT